MRQAEVYYKDKLAGTITQLDDSSYVFSYQEEWLENPTLPAISLSLPKQKETYCSDSLFPFFFNMLPEGTNKMTVCAQHRLDSDDYFGILTTVARHDSIGAVRVVKK